MLTGWPIGHQVLRNGHPVTRVWPSSWKLGSSFLGAICYIMSFEKRRNIKRAIIHLLWISAFNFIVFGASVTGAIHHDPQCYRGKIDIRY